MMNTIGCPHCATPIFEGEECGCDGAEIQRLEKRVKELTEALRPFARAFSEATFMGSVPLENIYLWKPQGSHEYFYGITAADVKAAFEVLDALGDDNE